MLLTGRCATHPSREAQLRCRSCGRWLCDLCVRVLAGHIYCSRACQLRTLAHTTSLACQKLLRVEVSPLVALAVVAGSAALLLTSVGLRVAELLEVSSFEGPTLVWSPPPPARLQGSLTRQGSAWQLEITGPADSAVLVVADGRPRVVVSLDGGGRGVAADLESGATAPRVEMVPLASGAVAVVATAALPSPAPRVTALVRTTPVPLPTAPAPPLGAADRLAAAGAPPSIHLVPDAGRRLAITFDGGSTVNGSAALLDLLHTLDLKVTIFVTGGFIEREPGLARRAAVEGHEIGNHTFSHEHLTTYAVDHSQRLLPHVSRQWFREQLLHTDEAFYRATGRHLAPLWRAPYGEDNALLRGWAAELGYLHVHWSTLPGATLDARDWVDNEHSSLYLDSRRMMERLLRFPQLEGGIVLMHLATDRSEPPWQALPDFLAALQRRGIEPVTVSELLRSSGMWRRRLTEVSARLGSERETVSSEAGPPARSSSPRSR